MSAVPKVINMYFVFILPIGPCKMTTMCVCRVCVDNLCDSAAKCFSLGGEKGNKMDGNFMYFAMPLRSVRPDMINSYFSQQPLMSAYWIRFCGAGERVPSSVHSMMRSLQWHMPAAKIFLSCFAIYFQTENAISLTTCRASTLSAQGVCVGSLFIVHGEQYIVLYNIHIYSKPNFYVFACNMRQQRHRTYANGSVCELCGLFKLVHNLYL